MRNHYYVYELIDPRTNEVFYIGKGKGKRMYQHEKSAKTNCSVNSKKTGVILDIHNAGLEVLYKVVADGLTEAEAFNLEHKLISEGKEYLTNIAGGVNKNYVRDWAINLLKTTTNPYKKENASELEIGVYDQILKMSASCFDINGFTETVKGGSRHIEYHYY